MNQGEDLDCGVAGLTSRLVGEHGAEDAGIGWLRKQVVALDQAQGAAGFPVASEPRHLARNAEIDLEPVIVEADP